MSVSLLIVGLIIAQAASEQQGKLDMRYSFCVYCRIAKQWRNVRFALSYMHV